MVKTTYFTSIVQLVFLYFAQSNDNLKVIRLHERVLYAVFLEELHLLFLSV